MQKNLDFDAFQNYNLLFIIVFDFMYHIYFFFRLKSTSINYIKIVNQDLTIIHLK